MADILIPDVPEDVITGIDIKARRLGLPRADYILPVLTRELAVQQVHVSVTDLVDFTTASATSATSTPMNRAWRNTEPEAPTTDEDADGPYNDR